MTDYCDFAPGHPWHGPYHDSEYGFPVRDDSVLFERLVLEINQAGLSWLTILKKRERFSVAYDAFDIDRVAAYGERERTRLLSDAGIIRNRLKVDAAIANAQRLQEIRASHGSFADWLDSVRDGSPSAKGVYFTERDLEFSIDDALENFQVHLFWRFRPEWVTSEEGLTISFPLDQIDLDSASQSLRRQLAAFPGRPPIENAT